MNEILNWPHCPVCHIELAPTPNPKCFSCHRHGFFYPRIARKRGRPRKVALVERAEPTVYKPYKDA